MGLVRLSVLPVDAVLSAKVDVLLAHVLPTLVVTCGLDAQAQAVLSIGLVRFECLESVALALEVSHGPETRCIVDKYHPVEVALGRWGGELALEVSVDQGKANEFPGGKARDGVAVKLASKAGLAETRGGALGANGEATDKLLLHHRAQIIEIDMPTALVPQGEVLITGGGRREGSLRLGDSVALEVAHIVLIDMGLEAQLSLVVEQHRGRRELDSVGLLPGEVENGQQVASQVRDVQHIMEDNGRGQNSVHSGWL